MSQSNNPKGELFDWAQAVARKDATHEDMMSIYNTWNTYDQDLEVVGYMGPKFLCQYFDKHARAFGFPKDALILDVAAGTGIQGVMLKEEYGYTRIDATDASQAMLDQAREHGVYRNFYCCRIGDGYKLPMEDDVYDAAVMCGALAVGHIMCDAFLELIRVVKPGGLIVNVMREEFTRTLEEFQKLPPYFQKWADEKKWECVEQVIPPVKYYNDFDALVHVYKVL